MSKKLIVVSSFPDQGEIQSAQTVGVASYTKTLLQAMAAQNQWREIVVLAEKIPTYQNYREGNIEVERVWERGNLGSLWRLARRLQKHVDDQVLVEFEINEFGSPLATVWFVLLLILLRWSGVRVTLVMHQVVGDFVALEGKNFTSVIKNLVKEILYASIKLGTDKMIVFEQELKNYLGGDDKIIVVPHFVTPTPAIDQAACRQELGWSQDQHYLLCFGYIAPYKGIRELLELWPQQLGSVHLIIAGGANPNHADSPQVHTYINQVQELAQAKGVEVTGFVPEEKMPLYLSACDAMIFPYKIFMSSSGPLAFAFSYSKPVILSSALSPYLQTADFAKAIADLDIRLSDFTYAPTAHDLEKVISHVLNDREQFVSLSQHMAAARSLEQIAAQTWEVLEQ